MLPYQSLSKVEHSLDRFGDGGAAAVASGDDHHAADELEGLGCERERTRKRRREDSPSHASPALERNIANLDLPPTEEIYYHAVCKQKRQGAPKDAPLESIRLFKKIPGAASIEDAQAGGYFNYRMPKSTTDDKGDDKGKDTESIWTDLVERSFQKHIRRILPMGKIKVWAWVRPEKCKNDIKDEWVWKKCGRNELLASVIEKETGCELDRKKISSHLQVSKGKLGRPLDRVFRDAQGKPAFQDETALIYEEWRSTGGIRWNEEKGELEPEKPGGHSKMHAFESRRARNAIPRALVDPTHLQSSHSGSDDDFHITEMQFGTYLTTSPNNNQNILHQYASTKDPSEGSLQGDDQVPDLDVFYPHIGSFGSLGRREQMILCEAKLDLHSDFSHDGKYMGTTMRASIHCNLPWTEWRVKVTGYLNCGEKIVSEEKICEQSHLGTNFINLPIHACPHYWTQLLTDCAWVEQECEQKYRASLYKAFDHVRSGEDSNASAEDLRLVSDADAERRQRTAEILRSASFVQELFAGTAGESPSLQRVAIIFWKFSEAPRDTAGIWSWKRVSFKSVNSRPRHLIQSNAPDRYQAAEMPTAVSSKMRRSPHRSIGLSHGERTTSEVRIRTEPLMSNFVQPRSQFNHVQSRSARLRAFQQKSDALCSESPVTNALGIMFPKSEHDDFRSNDSWHLASSGTQIAKRVRYGNGSRTVKPQSWPSALHTNMKPDGLSMDYPLSTQYTESPLESSGQWCNSIPSNLFFSSAATSVISVPNTIGMPFDPLDMDESYQVSPDFAATFSQQYLRNTGESLVAQAYIPPVPKECVVKSSKEADPSKDFSEHVKRESAVIHQPQPWFGNTLPLVANIEGNVTVQSNRLPVSDSFSVPNSVSTSWTTVSGAISPQLIAQSKNFETDSGLKEVETEHGPLARYDSCNMITTDVQREEGDGSPPPHTIRTTEADREPFEVICSSIGGDNACRDELEAFNEIIGGDNDIFGDLSTVDDCLLDLQEATASFDTDAATLDDWARAHFDGSEKQAGLLSPSPSPEVRYGIPPQSNYAPIRSKPSSTPNLQDPSQLGSPVEPSVDFVPNPISQSLENQLQRVANFVAGTDRQTETTGTASDELLPLGESIQDAVVATRRQDNQAGLEPYRSHNYDGSGNSSPVTRLKAYLDAAVPRAVVSHRSEEPVVRELEDEDEEFILLNSPTQQDVDALGHSLS